MKRAVRIVIVILGALSYAVALVLLANEYRILHYIEMLWKWLGG